MRSVLIRVCRVGRLGVALLVAGCNQTSDPTRTPVQPERFSEVDSLNLTARASRGGGRPMSYAPDPSRPSGQIYVGSPDGVGGGPVRAGGYGPGATVQGNDLYTLDFTDAPIGAVVQAVIGDIEHAAFVIDPRVQGTITLSSGVAIPRPAVLAALEAALRVNNAVLIREGALYRVVPASDAAGAGRAEWSQDGAAGGPGFGLSVVPLRYASAQAVLRLVEGFGTRPGAVRADTAANILVISGTAEERAAAIQTVRAFDVDWMSNQSVGIFPVTNASPEAVIRELNTLLNASGGGGLADIRLQPMERINAVMAVSRQTRLIENVGRWIQRLDRADYNAARMKIYRVKYGRAADLVSIINSTILGGNGGGGAIDTLAPGATPTRGLSGGSGSGFGDSPASGTGSGSGGSSGGGGKSGSSQGTGSTAQTGDAGNGGASFGGSGGGGSGGAGAGSDPGGAGQGSSDMTGGGGGSGGGNLFQNVRVTADPGANAVVVYANAEQYQVIERALMDLDREPMQVAIEATIAEVTLTEQLRYGVQFFLRTNSGGTGFAVANFAGQTALNEVAPGFNFIIGREGEPRVILDLLRGITKVKILSSPSLVVLNNETASLQVGDQVPVITRTAQSVDNPDAPTVNQVEFRNTGVILNVRPRIAANDQVAIEVEQEISSVVKNTNSNTLTPTISQRRIRSMISVPNRQTVLLGGLIAERSQQSNSGAPGLMDVPVVGKLFTSVDNSRDRTELIVFIKPQIIRNAQDAQDVASSLRARMFAGSPQR